MVAKELAEDEDNKTDRYLVVSILEALSNISIPEDWEVAKAVVVFLRSALETVDEESPFTVVTLKLAINVTNHESAASEFNHLTILTKLSTSISEAFGQAQRDVEHGNPLDHGYDQLLLLLGILINILEHCSLARESVDSASLKQLSAIWAKNVSSLHDADSVGKSKLSVAFGYLAIAVGYFYIITSNRLEMKHYDNWPGTLQLISTIHDFIGIYRTTNAKVDELEMLVQDLRLLRSTENFVS
ncbi:hypothetical protein VHEMI10077 [[Torrubiella] hemipterigena]|uniref:Wings apart-like protein C-terminal domain-containing protein n=1 Tax=[Torrubiella] hemipterigena TaxID=1531966 RepID=A0A0A1THV6_9HYPO|nr:hypothetical protein VHEMI10077 [[Torrubiella] hemipterigena]